MGRQPRAKPDLSLLEGVKAYAPVDFGRLRQRIQIEQMETPSNPPEWTYTTGFTAQEAANALVRTFGGQSYVDDGQGGLISTDHLTPIYQFGKAEPTGYIDDVTHRFWRMEQDEMRSPQYEDAVVCYEEC